METLCNRLACEIILSQNTSQTGRTLTLSTEQTGQVISPVQYFIYWIQITLLVAICLTAVFLVSVAPLTHPETFINVKDL